MSKTFDKILHKLGSILARNHGKKPYSTIANICKYLWWKYENFDYNFRTNGESFVIKSIISSLDSNSQVFDVGANHGQWSKEFRTYSPDPILHVFEISPINYEKLNKNLNAGTKTKIVNLGMSSSSGRIDFYHNKSNPSNSKFIKDESLPEDGIVHMKVDVTSIDEYCDLNKIDHISFLKIDTEGMDYDVLLGASKMLINNRIDMIQFEYGRSSVDTGHLLKNHFELLHSYGYKVGKIYPNYIDFKSFERDMEDFIGPNYLAVRNQMEISTYNL